MANLLYDKYLLIIISYFSYFQILAACDTLELQATALQFDNDIAKEYTYVSQNDDSRNRRLRTGVFDA